MLKIRILTDNEPKNGSIKGPSTVGQSAQNCLNTPFACRFHIYTPKLGVDIILKDFYFHEAPYCTNGRNVRKVIINVKVADMVNIGGHESFQVTVKVMKKIVTPVRQCQNPEILVLSPPFLHYSYVTTCMICSLIHPLKWALGRASIVNSINDFIFMPSLFWALYFSNRRRIARILKLWKGS